MLLAVEGVWVRVCAGKDLAVLMTTCPAGSREPALLCRSAACPNHTWSFVRMTAIAFRPVLCHAASARHAQVCKLLSPNGKVGKQEQ